MTTSSLNRIPITPWVLGTVEKAKQTGVDDARTWNRCWFETYVELGGASKSCGTKGCPRAGARGLWLLGRLKSGGRPFVATTPADVTAEVSKNAAYAMIASELLAQGVSPVQLWSIVQGRFKSATGEIPADSEQGEVRIAIALHRDGELVVQPARPGSY